MRTLRQGQILPMPIALVMDLRIRAAESILRVHA
jgi:hypothetical protein